MHDNLRAIRRRLGISGSDMSALLGLKTVPAYYKKETGNVKFTIDEAKLIADRFDMSIEAIFFDCALSSKDNAGDQH